jgi:hypothetical protein
MAFKVKGPLLIEFGHSLNGSNRPVPVIGVIKGSACFVA